MIVGLVSPKDVIEKRFEAEIPEKISYKPNYIIHPGEFCIMLSSANTNSFVEYEYGMTPFWSKEQVKFPLAKVEHNANENREVVLRKDIIRNPVFRKAIRSQRGILPVDYFIVPDANNKPFLIFSPDKKRRPLGLACIWDCWKKEIQDPLTFGFSIITIPAFGAFKEAGLQYLPLIPEEHQYRKWLKPGLLLTEVTEMIVPVPKTELNGFPVSPAVWNSHENDKSLILPTGEMLISQKPEMPRPVLDKFQKKNAHHDPNFHWGYIK